MSGENKQMVIIDFGKCFRIDVSENKFKIIEPLDVLLHAIHLCNHKYIKMDLQARFQDQLDEDIKKHSDTICGYFDCLRDNIIQDIEKNLLDTYRAQVRLAFATERTERRELLAIRSATQGTQAPPQMNPTDDLMLMPFYQIFLGSIEVLMEHYFRLGSLRYIFIIYFSIFFRFNFNLFLNIDQLAIYLENFTRSIK